jgi:hypothetical protein
MSRIVLGQDPEGVLANLASLTCQLYLPIPREYRLSAGMKPRLLAKKRKELLPDYDNGPKELTTWNLNKLLSVGPTNKGKLNQFIRFWRKL